MLVRNNCFLLCCSEILFSDYAAQGQRGRREVTLPDSLSAYLGLLPPAHRLQLIITAKPFRTKLCHILYQTIPTISTTSTQAEANHNSQTIFNILYHHQHTAKQPNHIQYQLYHILCQLYTVHSVLAYLLPAAHRLKLTITAKPYSINTRVPNYTIFYTNNILLDRIINNF